MNIRDNGTILRLYPYGDHGAIVCWCSEAHGILRTAARNAFKQGAGFTGAVDLFHECEMVYKAPKRGDLGTLVSAQLIDPRLPLRGDILRLMLSGYMAQLLLCTVELGEETPAWHELVARALDYTAAAACLTPAILERFELRLVQLHGLYTPTVPAYRLLQEHFSQLPPGREELCARLRRHHQTPRPLF